MKKITEEYFNTVLNLFETLDVSPSASQRLVEDLCSCEFTRMDEAEAAPAQGAPAQAAPNKGGNGPFKKMLDWFKKQNSIEKTSQKMSEGFNIMLKAVQASGLDTDGKDAAYLTNIINSVNASMETLKTATNEMDELRVRFDEEMKNVVQPEGEEATDKNQEGEATAEGNEAEASTEEATEEATEDTNEESNEEAPADDTATEENSEEPKEEEKK